MQKYNVYANQYIISRQRPNSAELLIGTAILCEDTELLCLVGIFLILCSCVLLQFGFITYEVGESKKLFFHVKEVQDGLELQTGDEVEFSVILNQRTGKCSACNVRRVR